MLDETGLRENTILIFMTDNGTWHISVEESAEYEFELRRWPVEADASISASVKKPGYDNEGKALPIVMARIEIADVDLSKPVSPEDKSITFKMNLNTGKTQTGIEYKNLSTS